MTALRQQHSPLNDVGTRIRKLRVERGITLAELSDKSSISVAMLSNTERGKVSPSLKTLERIRIALDVQLAAFFSLAPDAQAEEGLKSFVVHESDRAKLSFEQYGFTKELLAPTTHPGLEIVMLVIDPGGGSGPKPWSRDGEKAGYVLEGAFQLTVGEHTRLLKAGDSFRFDSSTPHRFHNPRDTMAKVIWIINSHSPA